MTARRRGRGRGSGGSPQPGPPVKIVVLGTALEVASGVPLLDAFERLCPDTVPGGRFCRKHECGNSKFYYRRPGEELEQKARACRFEAVEGMEITVLSAELKWALKALLS